MVRALILVTLGAQLVGCSGASTCQSRKGSYKVTLRSTSGNCGEIADQVIVLGGASSEAAAQQCRGTATDGPNMCSTTVDIACPTGTGAYVEQRGKVSWNGDGSAGDGEIALTLRNPGGSASCSGVYAISYRRQ